MHVITESQDIFLLRFDRNEELTSGLIDFCKQKEIKGASFTALGAAKKLTISFYNLPDKTYEDHDVIENTEIVSVTGNVAMMDGQIAIHAHGVFAKQDLATIGGHIKKLVVYATCEVTLWKLSGTIERTYDDETGLNLLK